MKKVSFVVSFIGLFLMIFISPTAYAATPITIDNAYVLANGNTYDISEHPTNPIEIATTQSITITQSSNTTYTDVIITCTVAGVDLTLDSVKISRQVIDSGGSFVGVGSALSFTGASNTLTIVGESTLRSGKDSAGISVPQGTSLEIKGSGKIAAYGGGFYGAGIGGGNLETCGTVTISSGTIYATSRTAAGIGGGSQGDGGSVIITGGFVTATCGGMYGAGIGGGQGGDGGTVSITGGKVIAKSNYMGAGIGGGMSGDGGNVSISGGLVFAQGYNDIGNGDSNNNQGALSISGDSVVFLKINRSDNITTSTHSLHDTETLSGKKAYSIVLPNDWTSGTAYAYLSTVTYTVTYDAGANASFETGAITTESVNAQACPSDPPTIISNDGLVLAGWTDGTTTGPLDDFVITSNITLTAVMKKEDVTSSSNMKSGNLTGLLYDVSGNSLEGYEITLHSDPVTTTTNSVGVFSFSNINYTNHTLYITNPSGTLLEQYAINFVYGSLASASASGNDITITYTDETSSIHLNFQANSSLNGVTFLDASFVVNPTTYDNSTWFKSIINTITNWFK